MNSLKKRGQIKVCLDTNVWISAVLRGGKPAEIIDLIERGEVAVFISLPIIHEIQRVLHYPKIRDLLSGTGLTVATIIRKIISISHVVSAEERLDIASDESDNRILECANAAQVNFIVSGDKHLLELKHYHEIEIVSPANFLAE